MNSFARKGDTYTRSRIIVEIRQWSFMRFQDWLNSERRQIRDSPERDGFLTRFHAVSRVRAVSLKWRNKRTSVRIEKPGRRKNFISDLHTQELRSVQLEEARRAARVNKARFGRCARARRKSHPPLHPPSPLPPHGSRRSPPLSEEEGDSIKNSSHGLARDLARATASAWVARGKAKGKGRGEEIRTSSSARGISSDPRAS